MSRISVAMCTYKGAAFVEEQIRSIAEQERPPDELVISDDHSPDHTVDAVHVAISGLSIPTRVLVNQRNIGSTRNFEQAIRHCTGDVIALADQDDAWLPHKLAHLERRLAEDPRRLLVFSDALVADPNLEPTGRTLFRSIGFTRSEKHAVRSGRGIEVLLRHNVVTGATMAFRSSIREQILPIPEGWVHDAWIALIAANLGTIDYLDEALILYRQHGGSQIGAPAASLHARLRDHQKDRTRLLRQASTAWSSVVSAPPNFLSSGTMQKIRSKQKHVQKRAQLPSHGLGRLRTVLGELARGRYHRYSRGLQAAVVDLVARRVDSPPVQGGSFER